MIEFFDPGMSDDVILNDGERLLQVHTTNPMNDDGLCFVADDHEIEDEDFEDEIRFALRRRYGRSLMYLGWQDVTDLYV